MKRIVIAAANGFLGSNLIEHLSTEYEVVGLVRKLLPDHENVRYVEWDGHSLGDWQSELDGAFALINLAGRSVDCRYNEKNKSDILNSRLDSTEVLGQAIDLCEHRPKIWMNSASATIYRDSRDKPMTEMDHEIGSGFSVDVCRKWEKAFFDFTYNDVRQIALRITIVFGEGGGAFEPMKNLAKFWMGGRQGDGGQMISWIHVDDFRRAVSYLLLNKDLYGSINLAAPGPVTNAEFMRELRNGTNRSWGLPTPKWLLEIGARIIKTETELILKSRFVVPGILEKSGFKFKFPNVKSAIKDLLQEP